jgi:hypothetical protein
LTRAWNDAAAELADKVAAMVSPAHPVNFEMANVSAVGAATVDAARAALEAQLMQHHFRLTRSENAETVLRATLAESSERYVWTAEIRQKDSADAEPRVAIVSVAKSDFSDPPSGAPTITLRMRLVWTQAAKFLDFREIAANAGADGEFVVLEPSQVVVYSAKGSTWDVQERVPVKQSKPWPRDVRGYLKGSYEKIGYAMPGITCAQGNEPLPAMTCQAGLNDPLPRVAIVPGVDVGDAVEMGSTCGDSRAMVASGIGDWTQIDSLRGYLVAQNRVAGTGVALETNGPVISLVPEATTILTARAVVRNLKTGNYEGYLVTASCSQ